MKVWISRYALTKGIYEIEAEEISPGDVMNLGKCSWDNEYYHGNDWHRTKQAAIDRAEEMRRMKIQSLKKQLDKLEKLKFE